MFRLFCFDDQESMLQLTNLVVLGLELEESLRVVANRANLGCLRTNDDVSAVAALPDAVAVAREDEAFLDVLQQLAIALFVFTFNLGDTAEFLGNLSESFLVGLASHTVVHIGPLEVLTIGSSLQVLGC